MIDRLICVLRWQYGGLHNGIYTCMIHVRMEGSWDAV